jgi:hypothetical protein
MKVFCRLVFLLILLSAASVAQLPTAGVCKFYDPVVVRLNGTLLKKTLQPDTAGERGGGNAEAVWLLRLDSPLCVYEDKTSLSHYPGQKGVQQVELIVNQQTAVQAALLTGNKVVATGTLSAPRTAHHYTAVILTVTNIERTRR